MTSKICSTNLIDNKINKWKITTLTYNVNRQCSSENIVNKWLSGQDNILTSEIVSIALQEVPHNEIFWKTSNTLTWFELLCKWLNNNGFILVNKNYLVTNLLLIFFKEKKLFLIKKIEMRWNRKTLIGHKGTISSCIHLKNNSAIIFITSHFIHGDNNTNLRIDQYKQSTYCLFDDLFLTNKLVIWFGDFNFRISGCSDTPNSLIEKIKHDSNSMVFSTFIDNYDQLLTNKRKGLIFNGFNEAKITFKPTYRILVENGNYDSLRMPSWCDRVLYKIEDNNKLEILQYDCSSSIISSDHFPVSAVFQLEMPTELNLENQQWDCYFENYLTWFTKIPFICRFSLKSYFYKNISSFNDWIGIYSEFINAIDKPIQWVYLMTSYTDSSKNTSSFLEQDSDNIFMAVEFSNLEKGRYKLGYFSKQYNCLCGLSNVFVVNDII